MPHTKEQAKAHYIKVRAQREVAQLCMRCGRHPRSNGYATCADCREFVKRYNNTPAQYANARRTFIRIREAAFLAYGGYKCNCCGESERLFLEIDHVANDGATHLIGKAQRRARGYDLYLWLKREGYPPGFQVLCSSCNQGKRRNGGVCPHILNSIEMNLIGACG